MKKSLNMLLRVVTSFLHHSELPKFLKSSLVEFHIKVSGLIYITSAFQKECVSWNAWIWTLTSSSECLGDTIHLEAKFWMSFKTWTDLMWSTNRQPCMFDDTLWLSQARKMTGWRNHVTIFSYRLESWRPWNLADLTFLTMWHEFRFDLSFWLTLFWFDTRLQGTYQHLLFHLL